MAIVYLDEDVAMALAQILASYGHHVTDAHAERQEEQPDPAQLLFAAQSNRTLLAYNGRDHLLLHQAWSIWTHQWGVPDRHAGIILVPHVRPDQIAQLAREIDDILTRNDTELENALYYLPTLGGEWMRNPRRLNR
ncbi:MAG: hypothetical protein ACYDAR_02220 [Thermomicrobiales bacterium]